MTRYFKATNGEFTIFRATESRVYVSGWMRIDRVLKRYAEGAYVPTGEAIPIDCGFSAKPGMCPAVEIGKGEYETLAALKNRRSQNSAPRNSWVRNADLEAV